MKTIPQKIGFANVMKGKSLHTKLSGKIMGRSKVPPIISKYHSAECTIVANVDFGCLLYVDKKVKDQIQFED